MANIKSPYPKPSREKIQCAWCQNPRSESEMLPTKVCGERVCKSCWKKRDVLTGKEDKHLRKLMHQYGTAVNFRKYTR